MKIAVLGTGLMGTAMAEAILNAGHQVVVYNRTESKALPLVQKGARLARSAAEAIREADATLVVLLNGAGVKEVLLDPNVLAQVRGKRIINASTTRLDEILEVNQAVQQAGGHFAEMTIMVENQALRSGQGQFLLACPPEEEAFWTELFQGFSVGCQRIGVVGEGTKLEVMNLLGSMFSLTTLAYMVALAQKLGIPEQTYAPFASMMVPGADYLLPKMTSHRYDEIFGAMDSYTSGLETSIHSAHSVGMPTAVLTEMLNLFQAAEARGYGKMDGSAVLEVLLSPSEATPL